MNPGGQRRSRSKLWENNKGGFDTRHSTKLASPRRAFLALSRASAAASSMKTMILVLLLVAFAAAKQPCNPRRQRQQICQSKGGSLSIRYRRPWQGLSDQRPTICYHLTPSAASQESQFELRHICGATRFHIEVRLVLREPLSKTSPRNRLAQASPSIRVSCTVVRSRPAPSQAP